MFCISVLGSEYFNELAQFFMLVLLRLDWSLFLHSHVVNFSDGLILRNTVNEYQPRCLIIPRLPRLVWQMQANLLCHCNGYE